jgi:hypothetical protein
MHKARLDGPDIFDEMKILGDRRTEEETTFTLFRSGKKAISGIGQGR